jgi:hypothetical protein
MDGYDFRLYLVKRLIPVDENTCYQVLEYVDPFCVLGCRRMVTINLLKGRYLTVEERVKASTILNDISNSMERRIQELSRGDLSKPDFKSLQELLKTVEKGTPEYKEILEKIHVAHKEWGERKKKRREIAWLDKHIKRVEKHAGLFKGTIAFKPEEIVHLATRCFLWDDGECEMGIQAFIESFINEPEFRTLIIEGRDERYHMNKIYNLLERILWEKMYPDTLKVPVYWMGKDIYRSMMSRMEKRIELHETYCRTVYQYLKENIGEIVGSEEYRNALTLGDEGIKKFIQQYVFEKVPPPQPI